MASLTISYSTSHPDVDAITLRDFNSLICSFPITAICLGVISMSKLQEKQSSHFLKEQCRTSASCGSWSYWSYKNSLLGTVSCVLSPVLYARVSSFPLMEALILASLFYRCIRFLKMCKPITAQGPSPLLTSQQTTKSLGVVGQKLTNAQTHSIITLEYNHTFSEKTG